MFFNMVISFFFWVIFRVSYNEKFVIIFKLYNLFYYFSYFFVY